MTSLESEKARLEKERQDFEKWKRREFEDLTAQHREEVARVEKRLDKIVQELSERASRELESTKDEARRFQKKLTNAKFQADAELRRERENAADPALKAAPATPAVPAEIRPGALIRVLSLGISGTVTSVQGGVVEIQAGNIKLRRPVSDLEMVTKAPLILPHNVHVEISSKPLERNEINLVGCRVDEALDRTDKFLDDAFLAQMTQLRIIHGSGTGALRQALTEFLQTHPHVAHFEFARQNEGGRGVTLVTLKD